MSDTPADGTEREFPVKIIGSDTYHTHRRCHYIEDTVKRIVEVEDTEDLDHCNFCSKLEESGVPER